MYTFGMLKNKMLEQLTESYRSQNKPEMKTIISLIKENKEFKEMFMFYDDIEKKYFDNKETATLYVEEISAILKGKNKSLASFSKKVNKQLTEVHAPLNPVYVCLDTLLEEDTLFNVDKKIIAKKWLVEHLMKVKELEALQESLNLVTNEPLLYAVLVNNFNSLYGNTLNESEQSELKEILDLNSDDLDKSIITLKEQVLTRISKILNEDTNTDLSKKLTDVKDEVESMDSTRFNYYKLKQLKSNL